MAHAACSGLEGRCSLCLEYLPQAEAVDPYWVALLGKLSVPLNLEKYQRCRRRMSTRAFCLRRTLRWLLILQKKHTGKNLLACLKEQCESQSLISTRASWTGPTASVVACCTTPLAKHTFWLLRSYTSPGFQTRASSARPWARPSPSTISSGGADGRDPPVELTGVIMRYHAVLQSNLASVAVDELQDSWMFFGDEVSGRVTGSVPPESLAAGRAAALLPSVSKESIFRKIFVSIRSEN